jgi:hypothetical protein
VKNIKDTRLSQKARLAFLVALLALLTLSSPKPIFASGGNIHINSTVPSGSVIEVQIGGNISLYFGLVNWSGGQVNLYLSKDGYSFLSSQNDVRFGPTFSVAKIRENATDSVTYPNYVVGKNWINGTIPKTVEVAGGNYFVKAFDGSSTAVAVSDIYFTVTASFEVAPEYGPGHAPMELRGYSLPPNDYVNISYYDGHSWKTIENFYRAGANGRLSYIMPAPDLAEALPAGVNPDSYSTITFRLAVNSTGQTFNGTFDEYRRGLRSSSFTGSTSESKATLQLRVNGSAQAQS